MEKRYQVFVSSTFMDLEKEREIAVQTLMKMDCIPSGMELFPAADIEQFEFIKKVIDDCDYYLLIIGGKYGSMTDEGISYTEKEYDYALEKGIKVIAFLHKAPEELPVKNSENCTETINKLKHFRNKVSTNRLVEFWENKDQLAGMVALGITSVKKMYPAIGWVRADKAPSSDVLSEINELRKENNELVKDINLLTKKLANYSTIEIENLADLDDFVTLNGTYPIKGESNNLLDFQRKEWVLNFKLADIFNKLSPKCEHHLNEESAEKSLTEIIVELVEKELTDLNTLAFSNTTVNNDCIVRIKYQLKALGLICITEAKSQGGPMAMYWMLTEKGIQKMMQKITFKKEAQ